MTSILFPQIAPPLYLLPLCSLSPLPRQPTLPSTFPLLLNYLVQFMLADYFVV